MSGDVTILSHLYPSTARPRSGPFVADEVAGSASEFDVSVIAPVRWLPPVGPRGWAAERAVPTETFVGGVKVTYPRVPALPFGGLGLETYLWAMSLDRLLRRTVRPGGILHAHFGIPDGYVATQVAKKVGAHSVVTFWGSDLLRFPRSAVLRRMVRTVIRDASRVVVVSAAMAEAAARLAGGAAREVEVIPGGVNESRFTTVDRASARKRFGFQDRERWLVWAGGLVPVKRPDVAIEAFARVAASDRSLRLFIAGEGRLRNRIAALVRELDLGATVRIAGPLDRPTIAELLVAADLAINSSESEGTPLFLTEALVAGTPVAAVPVGGVPALVMAIDGGTIAASGDAPDLAEAIQNELGLVRDRSELRRKASRYSLETTMLPIRAMYRELLRV